jgi:hypothetical protein
MAEIAYSYSEVDNPLPRKRERLEAAEEEDGEKTYEQRVEEFKNLTPRERKVAELRKKLKQSRYYIRTLSSRPFRSIRALQICPPPRYTVHHFNFNFTI